MAERTQNGTTIRVQRYTWKRTPSQIVYEVAALPAYVQEDSEAGQVDGTGDLSTVRQQTSSFALLYMFIGVTSLALMSFLSKLAYKYTDITPLEVTYARFLGLITGNVLVTWALGHTILEVSTGLEKGLVARAVFGTLAHICYCFALFLLDCSTAIVLNIANYPLNSVVALYHKGKFPKAMILIFLFSVAGIGMLVYSNGYWALVPLAGSLCMAISYSVVRQMKSEIYYLIPPTYLGVCGAIVSSWGLLLWHVSGQAPLPVTFHPGSFIYMVTISLFGWMSQIFQSWALQEETSWRTSVMTYIIVVYAFVFDAIVGDGKEFGALNLMGAAMLVAPNLINSARS